MSHPSLDEWIEISEKTIEDFNGQSHPSLDEWIEIALHMH